MLIKGRFAKVSKDGVIRNLKWFTPSMFEMPERNKDAENKNK
jgi:hypothetical protein